MAKRKPIVILDIPNETDLRRMYQLAVEYREMQPWHWMNDQDTFSVVDPVSGVRYYILVLGNAGVDYSLAAFRGAAGHAFLSDMRTNDKSLSDFNDRVRLEALYMTLENRSFLDKRELDDLRRFGIRCEGPHSWPSFRSMGTGFLPDQLNGSECRTMIHLLEQTLLIAQRAESDKSFLVNIYAEDEDDQLVYLPVYLTRFATVQAGELIWQEEYREAEQFQPVYPRIRLSDKEQLSHVCALPVDDDYKLEIDISYLNITIRGTNGARSYYPQLMTIISSDGFFVAFELFESMNEKSKSFDQQLKSIFNRLIKHMGVTQVRPGQIQTCRDEVYQLLEPICDQLDIQLMCLPILQETPRMVEEMMIGIDDQDDLEKLYEQED
jgi:hypothetical protein